MVHEAEDKSLAVYGVLFQVKHFGTFEDPFDSWNLNTTTAVEQKFPLPLTTPKGVFHYKGSLTTPDCTEGVQWFVNEHPVPIKQDNYLKIAKLINEGKTNNRDSQSLNGRKVIEVGTVCAKRKANPHPHRLRIEE